MARVRAKKNEKEKEKIGGRGVVLEHVFVLVAPRR